MKNQRKYKAFTLFELIISIIIIGIVMSSFPFIFKSTVQTSKNIIKEEVFFEEFTLLQLVNTRYFDENNTIGDNFYKDLNATDGTHHGDDELAIIKNTVSGKFSGDYCRKGKCQFNNNILRSGDANTTSAIQVDTASGEVVGQTSTYDDIDDFNDYNQTINYITVNNNHPKMYVNVAYISDNADYSSNNIDFNFTYSPVSRYTNIKLITVWCKIGDTNITLRYPTSNIGASKFLSLEELSR